MNRCFAAFLLKFYCLFRTIVLKKHFISRGDRAWHIMFFSVWSHVFSPYAVFLTSFPFFPFPRKCSQRTFQDSVCSLAYNWSKTINPKQIIFMVNIDKPETIWNSFITEKKGFMQHCRYMHWCLFVNSSFLQYMELFYCIVAILIYVYKQSINKPHWYIRQSLFWGVSCL